VGEIMLIEFDNTVALVKPEDEGEASAMELVRQDVKAMAPGAKYMYQHKLWLRTKGKKGWDGKTSIISKAHPSNGSSHMPTGILPMVYRALHQYNVGPSIRFKDLRVHPLTPGTGLHSLTLRGYQQDAFDVAIEHEFEGMRWPQGVFKIATGGGKTELACALYQGITVPTVFVVHRKHLIKQTRERFDKYGVPTGQIGDGVFEPDPDGVSVATIQTIHNILKGGDMKKINQFIKAEQIFFDEAHLCAASLDKGNQFITLSRQFRHAFYRWGLTATPFMKDVYSNQLLMGATGEVLYTISNDQLIKAGHLTKPKVIIIECVPVKGPQNWPDVYDSAIVLNRPRNIKIIDELLKVPTPSIVMCNRITHANILANLAKSKGLNLPVIQGSTSSADRAKVIADLQSGKIKHIIATTVFDEGMDLPELRSIILAGAGKSKVAQLQRIGRGLRKAQGKHAFTLIDFKDTSGRILKSHSKHRKDTWLAEGFDIEER
jgi:superfamily II DNA or RNA helicase